MRLRQSVRPEFRVIERLPPERARSCPVVDSTPLSSTLTIQIFQRTVALNGLQLVAIFFGQDVHDGQRKFRFRSQSRSQRLGAAYRREAAVEVAGKRVEVSKATQPERA